jgi:hypothetical protein
MKKTPFIPVLLLSLIAGVLVTALAEAVTHEDALALAAGVGSATLALLIAGLHRLFVIVVRLTEIRDILKAQSSDGKNKSAAMQS